MTGFEFLPVVIVVACFALTMRQQRNIARRQAAQWEAVAREKDARWGAVVARWRTADETNKAVIAKYEAMGRAMQPVADRRPGSLRDGAALTTGSENTASSGLPSLACVATTGDGNTVLGPLFPVCSGKVAGNTYADPSLVCVGYLAEGEAVQTKPAAPESFWSAVARLSKRPAP